MARFEPLVEVVKENSLPGNHAEAKVLMVENFLNPGINQPKNSRSRSSAITETC